MPHAHTPMHLFAYAATVDVAGLRWAAGPAAAQHRLRDQLGQRPPAWPRPGGCRQAVAAPTYYGEFEDIGDIFSKHAWEKPMLSGQMLQKIRTIGWARGGPRRSGLRRPAEHEGRRGEPGRIQSSCV